MSVLCWLPDHSTFVVTSVVGNCVNMIHVSMCFWCSFSLSCNRTILVQWGLMSTIASTLVSLFISCYFYSFIYLISHKRQLSLMLVCWYFRESTTLMFKLLDCVKKKMCPRTWAQSNRMQFVETKYHSMLITSNVVYQSFKLQVFTWLPAFQQILPEKGL